MSEKIQVETKDILIGQANIISEYAAEIDRLRAELAVKTDALEKIARPSCHLCENKTYKDCTAIKCKERYKNMAKSALSKEADLPEDPLRYY